MAAAAGVGEEEFAEVELEVAAILCDLKRILRARDRRWQRRQRQEAPEIPKWGRRRLRSVLEDKPAAAVDAERDDGAASPDTPLAFPESGGDDAPPEAEEDAKKATKHDEWVQEQHGVVATLSQENLHLLKQIEEYRARLQSSRSTNESLKQLHKARQQREQEQALALKLRMVAQRADPQPALDLNEPARAPLVEDDAAAAARARAMAMAEEWYRQGQRVALQKAAVTAEARRRRLEILRAKVASPRVSSRMRRVG